MPFVEDTELVVLLMQHCFELDNAELGILMDAVDIVKPGLVGGRALNAELRNKLEVLKLKVTGVGHGPRT